jgi:hypothetical protein
MRFRLPRQLPLCATQRKYNSGCARALVALGHAIDDLLAASTPMASSRRFDILDLGQVFTHIHDQEIEISEGFYLDLQTSFSRDCRGIARRCGDSQHSF